MILFLLSAAATFCGISWHYERKLSALWKHEAEFWHGLYLKEAKARDRLTVELMGGSCACAMAHEGECPSPRVSRPEDRS